MLWGQDWFQLNEKKSMESQTRLISWYWKQKTTWRKDLITYNSHLGLCFLLIDWLSFGEGGSGGGGGSGGSGGGGGEGWFAWNWMSKVKGTGGRILDVVRQGGGGFWKLDNFQGKYSTQIFKEKKCCSQVSLIILLWRTVDASWRIKYSTVTPRKCVVMEM